MRKALLAGAFLLILLLVGIWLFRVAERPRHVSRTSTLPPARTPSPPSPAPIAPETPPSTAQQQQQKKKIEVDVPAPPPRSLKAPRSGPPERAPERPPEPSLERRDPGRPPVEPRASPSTSPEPAPVPPRTIEIPTTAPSEAVAPPPPVPRSDPEVAAVQRVLDRYNQMYNDLDASAAASIWPRVNSQALARIFAGLSQQTLRFDGCAIAISGSRATVQCVGVLQYIPRVGNAKVHNERHSWTIQMERAGEAWQIVNVKAQ